MSNDKDICFVLSPIGEKDSPIRIHADNFIECILEPVLGDEYKILWADHIGEPVVITHQIIEQVIKAPLIIADLTGHNPNVFYELALRHATKKPYIQMIYAGEEGKLPFDVSVVRTIEYDFHMKYIGNAHEELKKQLEKIKKSPEDIQSPVSMSLDTLSLKSYKSDDEATQAMMALLTKLSSQIEQVVEKENRPGLGTDLAASLVPRVLGQRTVLSRTADEKPIRRPLKRRVETRKQDDKEK